MNGGPEMDGEVARALESLDPGSRDALYWPRFRRAVLEAAGPELARRRARLEPTVEDVMVSWGRALVPAAVLAAGLAALLTFQGPVEPAGPAMGVEELLAEGMDEAGLPAVLHAEREPDEMGVLLASDPSF